MLQPTEYFPCLCPLEQDAIRLVYASFVPAYFVVPCAPIDALYATSSANFSGRQEAFENMFGVVREDIEIIEGLPAVECYVGFAAFQVSWVLYDPIALGTRPTECRIMTYPA